MAVLNNRPCINTSVGIDHIRLDVKDIYDKRHGLNSLKHASLIDTVAVTYQTLIQTISVIHIITKNPMYWWKIANRNIVAEQLDLSGVAIYKSRANSNWGVVADLIGFDKMNIYDMRHISQLPPRI